MKRFWEIDFLRGIAIITMIVFHFLSDIVLLGKYNLNLDSGFWFYFGRITAIIFLLLVGISLNISYSRLKTKSFKKYLKRGLKIFSWGLLLTLLTFIFFKEGFIVFGILHLIGISIIAAYPFLKHPYFSLLIGLVFITRGIFLIKETADFPYLMWLGLKPENFSTIDYYPIIPWFGVVLIGIFLGNLLYKNNIRRFKIWDLSKISFIRFFSFLGKHSLLIYLIHQPILIIILYIFGIVSLPI